MLHNQESDIVHFFAALNISNLLSIPNFFLIKTYLKNITPSLHQHEEFNYFFE